MRPTLLMADDHSMICRAIRLSLDDVFEDMRGVGSCRQLLIELKRNTYTHLILDINLSDGSSLQIIPTIKELYPALRIVVFSMHPAKIFGDAVRIQHNVEYVSKKEEEEEIIKKFRAFLEGRKIEHPDVSSNDPDPALNPFISIAPREMEVLSFWLQGLGNKEISRSLNLANSTISTFKKRIFEKTGTSNLVELKDLASLYKIIE